MCLPEKPPPVSSIHSSTEISRSSLPPEKPKPGEPSKSHAWERSSPESLARHHRNPIFTSAKYANGAIAEWQDEDSSPRPSSCYIRSSSTKIRRSRVEEDYPFELPSHRRNGRLQQLEALSRPTIMPPTKLQPSSHQTPCPWRPLKLHHRLVDLPGPVGAHADEKQTSNLQVPMNLYKSAQRFCWRWEDEASVSSNPLSCGRQASFGGILAKLETGGGAKDRELKNPPPLHTLYAGSKKTNRCCMQKPPKKHP